MDSSTQARALFDFEGSVAGELSFTAEEILTIVNKDIGDGWWEAKNARSQTGLIPMSYVEIVPRNNNNNNNKTKAAPVPPNPAPRPAAEPRIHQQLSLNIPLSSNNARHGGGGGNNDGAWTDDEWEEDDDDDDEYADKGTSPPPYSPGSEKNDALQGRAQLQRSPSEGARLSQGSLRHRFSRSGPDAFLFDLVTLSSNTSINAIILTDGVNGPVWQEIPSAYTCTVASPTIEKKFHGIKTYTTYQLTPTFSNIRVSRRYKQFDWLYQRLTEKFTIIAIPPLPGKQISGRFEDQFVNARLRQLQIWIDRMCKHPVIAQSEVFMHFLACTDKKRWTAGKRKAEKDECCGERLFFAIKSEVRAADYKYDARLEGFSRFVKSMDDSVKSFIAVGERSAKKHEEAFCKHYHKIGGAFGQLAKSFELDSRPAASALTNALQNTCKTYHDIGGLFAAQPKNDVDELLIHLQEYHGILSTFPDILLVHKNATARLQERENSGKLGETETQVARERLDVIAASVTAESEHFHQHRLVDFNSCVADYLTQQIEFFKKITAKLEESRRQYQ